MKSTAITLMDERQKKVSLVLAVNGERFELPCVDPSTTLLHFLRSETCFKSPKLGCGEGNFPIFFTILLHVYYSICFLDKYALAVWISLLALWLIMQIPTYQARFGKIE